MKVSNKYLLWILVSFIISGLLEGYYPEGSDIVSAIVSVHPVVICILIFIWCGVHAEEHGFSNIGGYKLFSAIAPPLGIPTYFIKHFGFKKGLVKTFKAIGFFIILAASYLVPYNILA